MKKTSANCASQSDEFWAINLNMEILQKLDSVPAASKKLRTNLQIHYAVQGKQIARIVYLWPPKEANTNKIWNLQKCKYGLADATRYCYLRVKELIKLRANVSLVDPGLFYCKEDHKPVDILTWHVDEMIWGGKGNFKINIVNNPKNNFLFRSEEKKLSHTWAYN